MNKEFVLILTGVLIGVFLAPAPGIQTRKRLMRGLAALRDSAEEEASELVEESIQSLHNGVTGE